MAQRRQARAEAREIRMRDLERQQKEQEQNADRAFDMQTSATVDPLARSRLAMTSNAIGSLRGTTMSSRRSSEDSLEEEGRSLRDIRHELKVLFNIIIGGNSTNSNLLFRMSTNIYHFNAIHQFISFHLTGR